jgi:hypothetical protein
MNRRKMALRGPNILKTKNDVIPLFTILISGFLSLIRLIELVGRYLSRNLVKFDIVRVKIAVNDSLTLKVN